VLEVDEAGEVISYEEYLPFGATALRGGRRGGGFAPKRYRYTGKERDEETGLYYYGARYCAAWLGRWTSADPAGFVDGTNLYCYVSDSPVVLTDPDGREKDSSQEQNASDMNPNNPLNYGTFEDFESGAVGPWTEEGLHEAWDEAHPETAPPPSNAHEGPPLDVDPDPWGFAARPYDCSAGGRNPTVDEQERYCQENPTTCKVGLGLGLGVILAPAAYATGTVAAPLFSLGAPSKLGAVMILAAATQVKSSDDVGGHFGVAAAALGAKAGPTGQVAGASSQVLRKAPFNPTGSTENCVNDVIAFLKSVKTGRLVQATSHVAENEGSILKSLEQIRNATGAKTSSSAWAQVNTLKTARARQFFIVFRGNSKDVAEHVAVGIVNNGRSLIYDPQTGQRFWNLADFGDFTAWGVLLPK
jgi:RHS repeat-associated protein